MDLRDYRVEPDEGLYGKIERRVARRRRLRTGGVAAAAVLAMAAGVWLLTQRPSAEVAGAQPVASATVPAVVAEPTGVPVDAAGVAVATQPSASEAVARTADAVGAAALPEPEPLRVEAQPLAPQAEPVLPQPAVHSEAAPVAELILDETPEEAVDARLAAAKGQAGDTARRQHFSILKAPNIIVPDGEEEANRVFRLVSVEPVTDFSLTVFNRGGRVMFSSRDMQQAWDARHDGSLVPQGAYVWVARFRDSEGAIRQERGTVTVVR